ncbi:MAG: OmpA family protein [Acidobacteriota bacterium]
MIRPGESALLTWESRNADRVLIEPSIGAVETSGRIKFFPDASTTYTVTAQGPGGDIRRSVTVEVRAGGVASENIDQEDVRGMSPAEQFAALVKPVFFAFDSASLTTEACLTLDGNIRWLLKPENRRAHILLEGHSDERGTEEYNLALGDQRAVVVRDYLVEHGVDASRISVVSLGEERPFDTRRNEEGYALNRRTQFVLTGEE